jgi:hypothetical protein
MSDRQPEDVKTIDSWIAELQRRKAMLVGQQDQNDPATKVQRESDSASLWDKLSPSERLDLYYEDPDKWRELLAAKEQAGIRRLFQGRNW